METEIIQERILKQMMELTDKKLHEFMVPYLREAGIKGEITKGKIKWRGIKLKVRNLMGKSEYQLTQRGVDISPIFEINFSKLNK